MRISWAMKEDFTTFTEYRTGIHLVTPVSIFIKVDLPAPFPPIKLCTDSGLIEKETSSKTGTPEKALHIPFISTK